MNGGGRGKLAVLVLVLVVLHFVFRIGFGLGERFPDLLVVAVLLAARQMRAGWAAGLGLLLGFLEGALIPFSLGASALVLTVLGYLGARSRDFLAGDGPILIALYLFVGKWLYELLLYLVLWIDAQPGSASTLLLIAPLAALYAAAAGVVALTAYRSVA